MQAVLSPFLLIVTLCLSSFQAFQILPPVPVVCLSPQHITHSQARHKTQPSRMEHAKGTWALAAAAVCATGSLLYVAYKGGVTLKKKVRRRGRGSVVVSGARN